MGERGRAERPYGRGMATTRKSATRKTTVRKASSLKAGTEATGPRTRRAKRDISSTAEAPFTVPGLSIATGHSVGDTLQQRVHALNDLALTLKHAHWNVVGPHFIGVHKMLDPQIEGVREMVDVLAERMSTLGVPPNGLPGALVAARSWDDYDIMRADATAHLAALDLVYDGVIEDHRAAMDDTEADLVTQDILVGQVGQLELYQWFVRAHLQTADGVLSTAGADTEKTAAALALANSTSGTTRTRKTPSTTRKGAKSGG